MNKTDCSEMPCYLRAEYARLRDVMKGHLFGIEYAKDLLTAWERVESAWGDAAAFCLERQAEAAARLDAENIFAEHFNDTN